jgi:hypothetical protein
MTEHVPAKIGKVTYKDKNIVVFNNYAKLNTKHTTALSHIRGMFMEAPEDFDGYVVMGWNKDHSNMVLEWDTGELPYNCFPEFVKEAVRRSIDIAIYNGELRFGNNHLEDPSDEDGDEENDDEN